MAIDPPASRRPAVKDQAEAAKRIRDLISEGCNSNDASRELKLGPRQVHYIARRHRIELRSGNDGRYVSGPFRRRFRAAVNAIAQEANMAPSEVISEVLCVLTDGDGRQLRRIVQHLFRPKRPYVRREQREAIDAERAAAEAAAQAEAMARMPAAVKDAIAAGQHPLRAIRLHLGLRQVDVAERAGMGFYGDNRIGGLERGCFRLTPRMAERLAKAMGVEPAWLQLSPRTVPPAACRP